MLFPVSHVSGSYLKPILHLFNTEVMKPDDGETELTQIIKTIVMASEWEI
jgi:hypothetical protein